MQALIKRVRLERRISMRTYKDAKSMAKSLRKSLTAKNVALSHSECLEIVANVIGFADWNTLSAKLHVESGQLVPPEDCSESRPAGVRVLFVQKVAVFLLRRTSARPKLLIRRAGQHSARPEIGTCRGS